MNNKVLKIVPLICTTVLIAVGCSTTRQQVHITNDITRKFSLAVEKQDVAAFKSLFLNESITWLAIVSSQDFLKNKRLDPNAQKVNAHEVVPFIEWAAKTDKTTQVNFADCKSSGDVDVMTMDCAYEFYLDGQKTNFGRECFLLVNTEAGWKISGMAFSSSITGP